MIKHKAFVSTRVIALMLGATFITSGKAKADFVIPDDLIVQGSACVGLDCVDGESFGFDTLRLKENNTRIKFDDTSTSVGFPNNDWQLTANDSASGGLNKFSIENTTVATVPFTIVGSAPTNSLFVASTGKVGLRDRRHPGSIFTSLPATLPRSGSNKPAPAALPRRPGISAPTRRTSSFATSPAAAGCRSASGPARPPAASISMLSAMSASVRQVPGLNSAFATHILTVHGGTTRGMLELVNAQTDAAANTAGQVGFFATCQYLGDKRQTGRRYPVGHGGGYRARPRRQPAPVHQGKWRRGYRANAD